MKLKGIIGSALSFSMIFLCLTSCDNSAGAVVFADNQYVTAAQYMYFEFECLYQQMSYASTTEADKDKFLNQKSSKDGKTTSEVVRSTVLDKCKSFLALNKMFSDRNLSLTDEDRKKIDEDTEKSWGSIEKMMQEIGITKDDFKSCCPQTLEIKESKIFDSYYSEGGEKVINKDELFNFYKEKFMKVSYIQKSLIKKGEDDKPADPKNLKLSDEEINKVKSDFESYAKKISDKEKSIGDIYKEINGDGEGDGTSGIEEDKDFMLEMLPKDLVDLLKGLEKDKAVAHLYSTPRGDSMILFLKKDILEGLEEKFNDQEKKKEVLRVFKGEEFENALKEVRTKLNVSEKGEEIDKIGVSYMYDKILKIQKELPANPQANDGTSSKDESTEKKEPESNKSEEEDKKEERNEAN